jgi:hypothetical protein
LTETALAQSERPRIAGRPKPANRQMDELEALRRTENAALK